MKIPELLAPVGDYECLIAAVLGGADAVYFGGKNFNARSNASNFDDDEIIKAIDFAHLHNVKVYIVVNIILFENEISSFIEFMKLIYNSGVDAVIVQDMGAVYLINKLFPDLNIHLSTQATVVNSEAVKLLENQNIKRVVLGRELSLYEIKQIKENTHIELEIFVHGALCMSYSGKCLMSSFIGGRSGNRGNCAQPCRLRYKLQNEISNEILKEGHLLSTKDVSTIEILPELIETGISSLKIEGRMKRPEYVYNVVKVYRKYLNIITDSLKKTGEIVDYKVLEEDNDMLLMTFNRGGFSKGYLKPENNKLVTPSRCNNWGIKVGKVVDISISSKKVKVIIEKNVSRLDGIEVWDGKTFGTGKVLDVIYNKNNEKIEVATPGNVIQFYFNDITKIKKGDYVYKTFSQTMKNEWEKVKNQLYINKTNINAYFKARKEQRAELVLNDLKNEVVVYSDEIVQNAIKAGTADEKIKVNLQKTGDTMFNIEHITLDIEKGIFIPLSTINDMRRKACDKLDKIISDSYRRSFSNLTEFNNIIPITKNFDKNNEFKVIVDVYSLEQFTLVLDTEVDIIYYDIDALIVDIKEKDIFKLCEQKDIKLFIKIAHIFKQEKLAYLYNYIDNLILILKQEGKKFGVVFNDLGVYSYLKNKISEIECIADFGMNISNSYSIVAYGAMGVSGATLSVENTLGNIKKIEQKLSNFSFENNTYVHGYIPFLISEYCIISEQYNKFKNNNCLHMCKNKYAIIDRMGKKNVIKNNKLCQSIIYNSEVIYNADRINEFKKCGIKNIRIDLQFVENDKIVSLLNLYILSFKKFKKLDFSVLDFKFTRGYYNR